MAGAAAASPAGAPWPLSRRAQLLAGIVMSLANFMVILDLTIVNVSIPHVAGNLGISLDQGAWIITSYAVAEAICVPLTGWLSDRFGAVRVYIGGMTGFGIFSLLCGLSPTLGVLVLARVGQGFFGAPLMPITQALLLRVFPPEGRNKAMGIWSMTVLVAPAMGPILGGWITDNFSWHWIFLINIPIAILCVSVGSVVLRTVETPTTRRPIDRVGIALLVFWIGCLQIMLDIGRDRDWFDDWNVIGLAIAAAIGFIAFVIWELTEEHPAVNLRIFRHRIFAVGVLALSATYASYFATVVVIPQWLQVSQGYSAQQAGMVVAATACATVFMSLVVSRQLDRFDLRLLASLGTGWFAIQCFVRSGWTSGMDIWSMALPQFLQGFGISMFMMPLTQMSLGGVLPHEVPSAAGLQNFTRTVALAISTSLVLSTWSDHQRIATNGMVDVLRPEPVVRGLNEAGVGLDGARNVIQGLVNQQAMTIALDHIFLIAGVGALMASTLVWLSPRPRTLKHMQSSH